MMKPLSTLLLAAALLGGSAAEAPAQAALEPLQRAYDSFKTLIDPAVDVAGKRAAEDELVGKLGLGGALQHAAAYAFHYAMLPFHASPWNPPAAVAEKVQTIAIAKLSPAATPDAGTRRYLASVVGGLGARNPPLKDRTEEALAGVVRTDPDPHVVETAVQGLLPYYNQGSAKATQALRTLSADPRPTIQGLFGRQVSIPYSQPQAEPVESLHRSAEQALADAARGAALLAGRGRDVASNPWREPAGPQAVSNVPTWGGGGDVLSLLRGSLDYKNDFGYGTGPAFAGGAQGHRGVQGGWQSVTIDLRQERLIDEATLITYGGSYTPREFRVLVRVPGSSPDRWALAYETSQNQACMQGEPGCPIPVKFSAVLTDKVLLELNGASTERHVWLQRVEVRYQGGPVNIN